MCMEYSSQSLPHIVLTQVTPDGDSPGPAFPQLSEDGDGELLCHSAQILTQGQLQREPNFQDFPRASGPGISVAPLPVLLSPPFPLPSLLRVSLLLDAFLKRSMTHGHTVPGRPTALHSHQGKSAPIAQLKLSQTRENGEQAL